MMVPNFDVKDKVFVITGAAGILCSEMARELAALGAKVALLDLKQEGAQAVVNEITAAAGAAIAVGCNVLDRASIEAAKDKVLETYGQVDCLVNGAGGNHPQASANAELSFFDIPQEALRFVTDLNFMGTLMPSQIFGRVMADQGFGNIINIASMAGIRPLTRVVGYGAAKAAVGNLTQWMATWFAENVSPEIRVNAIAPGFLITQQNYYLMVDKDTGGPTARGGHVLQQTPMNRYGKPEELVGPVVFLASPAASFITGVVLPIDGGFSIYSI